MIDEVTKVINPLLKSYRRHRIIWLITQAHTDMVHSNTAIAMFEAID